MHETDEDLAELQRILDASAERGGEHLRTAFAQATRPSASRTAIALSGIFELHLAVVTSDGSPLVAPIDGILYRGKVWVGIPPKAVRAKLVRRDPRVSASCNTAEFAFIVHGRFHEVPVDEPDRRSFDALASSLYVEQHGDWFKGWMEDRDREHGPGVIGLIEPRRMFAKARDR